MTLLFSDPFNPRCSYAITAEQKARVIYDNILRLSDDPDANDAIHFQRLGEAVRLAKEKRDQKNIYFKNPAFDK